MANVLLGVTGSVAALKTPELFAALTRAGHQVRVVATQASLYFFDPRTLDPSRPMRNPEIVVLDEDEWPGREEGLLAQRGDAVLHIELRKWADLLLIAPLDANTLAKIANGLADNCLTCVYRAWDVKRPIVLAPAMNTLMWEHPATSGNLAQLMLHAGESQSKESEEPSVHRQFFQILRDRLAQNPDRLPTPIDRVTWINQLCRLLHVVPPQSKQLFCGDVGIGAMAEVQDIVAAVQEKLAIKSG